MPCGVSPDTSSSWHVLGCLRRQDAPQGQTQHPHRGMGSRAPGRGAPTLSRGQRKDRPSSRRDEQRGGQYSNRCTASRIGGGGERSERRARGQPHPQGRSGRGSAAQSRYEGMEEMREEDKFENGTWVQFGPAAVCLISPRGR